MSELIDVSKDRHIQFLREVINTLQKGVVEAYRQKTEREIAEACEAELIAKLSEELKVLRQRFFGGGRETLVKRPGKGVNRKNLIHNRVPVDVPARDMESLEIVEDMISLASEKCECGGCLQEMTNGYEESCEIDVEPPKYFVRRIKRVKARCVDCGRVVTAPVKDKLTPGAGFSIQMAVQVADDKFSRHLPLNRQVEAMAERGLQVEAKTLFGLTEHLVRRLQPIPEMIRMDILSQPCVGIDESPMPIIGEESKGYVWSLSNNHGAYFQYEPTRSGRVAEEMLAGYQGVVMSDGYQGYDFLEKVPGVVAANCMAHARRKFFDAKDNYPDAVPIVEKIDQLYEIDRKAVDMADLGRLREAESRPIVTSLLEYIEGRKGSYLQSSLFGKAVGYFQERQTKLLRFLDDVNIPLDNNTAERSQRDPVMGRNNFQGFRTINGADVAMDLYTIIRTCKMLDLSPRVYMLEMATRSARGEAVTSPWRWAKEIEKRTQPALEALAEQIKDLRPE